MQIAVQWWTTSREIWESEEVVRKMVEEEKKVFLRGVVCPGLKSWTFPTIAFKFAPAESRN